MSRLHPKSKHSLSVVRMLTMIGASLAMMAFAADQTKTHSAANELPQTPEGLKVFCDRTLSVIKDREAVQMLTAVLSGSQMGPGDGWFHPSLSRYGWKWLADRHQIAADGELPADKFQGDEEAFERLDRNGDGMLKADDFDWSADSPYVRQMSQSNTWFRGIDASSNGRLSREEWDQFFERVGGLKGFVTPEDLRAAVFPPPPKSAASQGPSMPILLKGLFQGELGSFWEGPALNSMAPNFELKTQNGDNSIRLSSFREMKPVVLIFGSFT